MREIYGMTLAEIRQDLLTADAARVQSYAAMAAPIAVPSASANEAEPPDGTSAADYLRRLRKAGAFGAKGTGAPPAQRAAVVSVPHAPAASPLLAPAPSGSSLARLAESVGAPRRIAPFPSEVARRRPRSHSHYARP